MALYSTIGDIGFITIDNPPVNSLSINVRRKIENSINNAENDDNVSVVILSGKRGVFCAGADIKEFHGPKAGFKPTNLDCVEIVENCSKPVIAAIDGFALGGGLELALGCHYRVASAMAKFGFPEVRLGILPGAGGTQRFPRLVGINAAMEWITNGNEYSADTAAKLGLLDRIYPAGVDIVECAVQFARTIKEKSVRNRVLSQAPVQDLAQVDDIFLKYKSIVEKKSRGAIAPIVALQVIKDTVRLPYSEGILKEKEAIKLLLDTDQSKAMVYVFFAERMAQKWSFQYQPIYGASPLDVKTVGVLGLGTMGRGIAIALLRAGMKEVCVMEMNSKALAAGVAFIKGVLKNDVRKGVLSDDKRIKLENVLVPTQDYAQFKDVDLVIEAVFENMELKKEIFKKLDNTCKPSAILASNTSALDIDEMASVTRRPDKVVGMHFFAPAHIMRLLENIRGSKSSPQSLVTAMSMGKKMKKVTVLVGNCRGFVGNRLYAYYTSEGDFLLEEGAYPEQVDAVLKDFGFAMGRHQVADLSGNDIGYRMRSSLGLTNKQQPPGTPERERNGRRYCPLSDLLVESGRFGYKSDGRGWFTYVGKQRELTVDPAVTKMIDDYRRRNNITPRYISSQEILERMLYPLINEGFKVLEDGIAANPSIIDLVLIHGYAWPRHTGGPMFYANTIGLPRVLEVIEEKWKVYGMRQPHWQPSELLRKLVKEHGNPNIADWMRLGASELKSSL